MIANSQANTSFLALFYQQLLPLERILKPEVIKRCLALLSHFVAATLAAACAAKQAEKPRALRIFCNKFLMQADSRADSYIWPMCPIFLRIEAGYTTPVSSPSEESFTLHLATEYLRLCKSLTDTGGLSLACMMTGQSRATLDWLSSLSTPDLESLASGCISKGALSFPMLDSLTNLATLSNAHIKTAARQQLGLCQSLRQEDTSAIWRLTHDHASTSIAARHLSSAVLAWLDTLPVELGSMCRTRIADALTSYQHRTPSRCTPARQHQLTTEVDWDLQKEMLWGLISRAVNKGSPSLDVAESIFAAAMLIPEVMPELKTEKAAKLIERTERLVAGVTPLFRS